MYPHIPARTACKKYIDRSLTRTKVAKLSMSTCSRTAHGIIGCGLEVRVMKSTICKVRFVTYFFCHFWHLISITTLLGHVDLKIWRFSCGQQQRWWQMKSLYPLRMHVSNDWYYILIPRVCARGKVITSVIVVIVVIIVVSTKIAKCHKTGVWQSALCHQTVESHKKLSSVCLKSLRMAHENLFSPATPIEHTYQCQVLFPFQNR